MCELLVRAIDNPLHTDPLKARFTWLTGDIVVAREDNDGTWEWGRLETLPPERGGKFVVVKMPGVTLRQLDQELKKTFTAGITDAPRDLSGNEIGRRLLKLDIKSLTGQRAEDADKLGTVELTRIEAAALTKLRTTTERERVRHAADDLGR